MPTALQVAGAQSAKQTRYAPIWTNRFWTGLWTQRNPLRDAATPYLYEKFYSGSRYDSIIGGLNTEISTRLTLVRAPGSSVYNSQTFPAIDSFYEFRQFSATGNETISIIADTAATVYDATGPSTQTSIFTKSTSAGQTYFQSVGNVLYFGDGVDQEKYININGKWTTQLWGIAIGSVNSSTPEYAGLGADVVIAGSQTVWANPTHIQGAPDASYATATLVGGSSTTNVARNPTSGGTFGPLPWSNPGNIVSNDNKVASCNITPGETSGTLTGATFGFAIPPTATILGISAVISRYRSGLSTFVADQLVSLVKNGVPTGNNKAAGGNWPTSKANQTYGASNDLWGTTWTPTQINAGNFGLTLAANNVDPTHFGSANVDSFTITVYYRFSSGATSFTDYLQGSTYGFSLSAGNIINGVQVVLKGFQTGSGGSLSVSLMKNGIPVGTPKKNVQMPGSNGFVTLGSASDLWGTSWFAGDINQTNFGVSIQGLNGSTSTQNWSMDSCQVIVYSFGAPSVTTAVGNLSPTVGYTWVYAYGNSGSGHVSTASQTFSLLGAQSNKEFKFTVTASTDPQVDQIRVFRTVDGGVTLFEHPITYPNSTGTITDNFPDSELNLFSQAPINDSNDPPPAGIGILAYHLGRVWGAVGNVVYYSQASLGASPGVPAESWPPNNYFIFPSLVNRLFPCAIGLLVFTTSDLYLIPNIQTSPYFGQPYPYVQGLGLLSYNAFSVNGTIVYVMTSDNQVVSLDPNSGVSEVGFPIGDIFETAYNPLQAYVTWHTSGSRDKALYVGDGSVGWYRMSAVSAPELGLSWSPQRQISGGTSAIQSVEVIPGQHTLLIGPASSGPILQRDYTTYSDNGTTYSSSAILGSIVLAHPGQKAILDFITTDCTAIGSVVSPSVLIDEIFGNFETLVNLTNATDPPDLPASSSLSVNRWYFTTTQQPAECRHLQIQFTWPVEAFQNELLSYTLFGAHFQEK